MNSFAQLFSVHLKIFFRNKQAFFWTIFMPGGIYIALSVLPIGKTAGLTTENYSNYVLPGIIAMTVMQTGIYGLAYWMVDLKSRGIIKRFMATPIKPWEFLSSIIASRLVIILLEIIVLTLLGVFVFNADFAGNIFSILILTLLGGSIFLAMGLLISNYASSYESAAPLTSAIGLPMTFLGNIFFPIESLPPALKTLSQLLPITYLADGYRQAYLYAFDFYTIGKDVLILAIWLLVISLIMLKVFKLKEE